jgi:hypothetical protein
VLRIELIVSSNAVPARESSPGHSKLIAFMSQLGLVSSDATRETLEQTILKTSRPR